MERQIGFAVWILGIVFTFFITTILSFMFHDSIEDFYSNYISTNEVKFTADGEGHDIPLNSIQELAKDFPLGNIDGHTYTINSATFKISQDEVRLNIDDWTAIANSDSSKESGTIRGNGERKGDTAYINYSGIAGTKKWRGLFILKLSDGGPMTGYFLTKHVEKNSGELGFGSVTFTRRPQNK